MNKLFLLIIWWFMPSALLWADLDSSSKEEGIIILNAVPLHEATNVAFTDIQWVNNNGGFVTASNGTKTEFLNEAVGKIIYYDSLFYARIDQNPGWIDWRAGIQNRELIFQSMSPLSLTSQDLQRIQSEEQILEDTTQRYPSSGSLITPRIALLKSDITQLSSGLVLQNGKWIPQQEANTLENASIVGEMNKPVTFTAKDGKTYENVKVTVTDTGLSLLTADGGSTVPFDQLPDDISAFPMSIREKIVSNRQANMAKPIAAVTLPGNNYTSDSKNVNKDNMAAQQAVESPLPDLPITKFEATIIGNFTPEEMKTYQVRSDDKDYFVPTFSDDFPPPTQAEGKNAIETILFINHKLIDLKIIYYDSSLKAFVCGTVVFTSKGRIRLEKWPIITFNPSDLNPDKMEKTTINNQISVWVYTTDNKKAIGGLTYNGLGINSDGFSLPVEDDHDAQSICNAVTHFIQLYGGKPEEF